MEITYSAITERTLRASCRVVRVALLCPRVCLCRSPHVLPCAGVASKGWRRGEKGGGAVQRGSGLASPRDDGLAGIWRRASARKWAQA
jgi:hypothetical protein